MPVWMRNCLSLAPGSLAVIFNSPSGDIVVEVDGELGADALGGDRLPGRVIRARADDHVRRAAGFRVFGKGAGLGRRRSGRCLRTMPVWVAGFAQRDAETESPLELLTLTMSSSIPAVRLRSGSTTRTWSGLPGLAMVAMWRSWSRSRPSPADARCGAIWPAAALETLPCARFRPSQPACRRCVVRLR